MEAGGQHVEEIQGHCAADQGWGSCSWRWPGGGGSCTGLGDREEPHCKGTGQPGAQVWPCFSGPSFVTASPKTAFSLPKEQSFDPLLMLRMEILVHK